MAKVCQALTHTKSSERIGEARALSCPWQCGRIVDGSYGFAMPKPCGRVGTVAMAVSRQSCAAVLDGS